jgi:hypothetical protein
MNRSTVPRNASTGNMREGFLNQLSDGLFMAVHLHGDFKPQPFFGHRAFFGQNLPHDPVAGPIEHLRSTRNLDVDRHRINQFLIFLLNDCHEMTSLRTLMYLPLQRASVPTREANKKSETH